jgi:hypothetical protein
MKSTRLLTIMSLLAALFASFHFADDITRGIEPGTLTNYPGVLILFVWLYAALALAERWPKYLILILASILGAGIPVVHMMGKGVGAIGRSSGGLFFVWTLHALGATALFSLILSVRGLWSLRRGRIGIRA